MNAYTGEEPYVFLSYSHADKETADKILIGMKQRMCRIWYDEGLTPGESWNDNLAERLKNAEIVMILLTKNAAASRYVITEINYAIAKKVKLLPVLLEQMDLPAGLEMMLCSTQYLDLTQENGDLEKQLSLITGHLPGNVFASKKDPFFETDDYSFYLEKETYVNGVSSSEKKADYFWITYKKKGSEDTEKLFEFHGSRAYDIDYTITQCKTMNDDYFVGNIRGLHIFNVLARCELDYPLSGPDFQLLLIMVLRTPEDELPTVSLVDYQYIHVWQSKLYEGEKIGETTWGRVIDEECKRKLCVTRDLC